MRLVARGHLGIRLILAEFNLLLPETFHELLGFLFLLSDDILLEHLGSDQLQYISQIAEDVLLCQNLLPQLVDLHLRFNLYLVQLVGDIVIL